MDKTYHFNFCVGYRRGLSILWSCLFSLMLSPTIFAAAQNLIQARFLASHGSARLLVTASEPLTYHVFTLDDPARLVLDLHNVQVKRGSFATHAAPNRLVKRLRYASKPNGDVRVVLDLWHIAPYKIYMLTKKTPRRNYQYLVLLEGNHRNFLANSKEKKLPDLFKNNTNATLSSKNSKKQSAVPMPKKQPDKRAVIDKHPTKPEPRLITEKRALDPKWNIISEKPAPKTASNYETSQSIVFVQSAQVLSQPESQIPKIFSILTADFNKPLAVNTAEEDKNSKLNQAVPLRKVVIIIDPGHGGKDPGALGPSGIKEKNVVFAIANYLEKDLNAEPGIEAVLTRTGDYYMKLRERLQIAHQHKGDLFIAIHADAYQASAMEGVSIFALSERGASSEAARWFAEKENQSELIGGVALDGKSHMLQSILLDLSQRAMIQYSLLLGKKMILAMQHEHIHLHKNNIEQAGFVVLKSPDIPSLLVETGFISSQTEEKNLRDPVYEQEMARAIFLGVKEYLWENPPKGSLLGMHKESARS